MLTAVTTLRQQNRDTLREAYLTEACAEATRGDQIPLLLPEVSVINSGG